MKKIYLSLTITISLLGIIYADRPISESDPNWKAIGISNEYPLWSGVIPRVSEHKKHPSSRSKRQAGEEEGAGTGQDEDETLEGEGEEEAGTAAEAQAASPEAPPQRPGNTKYKIRNRPNKYQNTGVDQGLAAEQEEESFASSSGNKKPPAKKPAAATDTKGTSSQSQSSSNTASANTKDTSSGSTSNSTTKPLSIEDNYEEFEFSTEPKEEAETTTPPSLIPVVANILKSIVGGTDNVTKPLNVTHTLNYASNLLLSPFGLEFNFLSPGSKNKNKPPTKPAKAPGTKPKQKPATKPKPKPPIELDLIPVKSPAQPVAPLGPVIPGLIVDEAPVGPIKGKDPLEKPFSPDAPFILYQRTVGPPTTTPYKKLVAPFRDFPFISPTVHPSPNRQTTQRNTTPYVKLVGAFSGRSDYSSNTNSEVEESGPKD